MIRIMRQAWDLMAEEYGVIYAHGAADRLGKMGFNVRVVEWDWPNAYYVETHDERAAVKSFDIDL